VCWRRRRQRNRRRKKSEHTKRGCDIWSKSRRDSVFRNSSSNSEQQKSDWISTNRPRMLPPLAPSLQIWLKNAISKILQLHYPHRISPLYHHQPRLHPRHTTRESPPREPPRRAPPRSLCQHRLLRHQTGRQLQCHEEWDNLFQPWHHR
jgi:hypothetical protein